MELRKHINGFWNQAKIKKVSARSACVRMYGWLNSRMCENGDVKRHGCKGAWMQEGMEARVNGCKDAWM